MIDTVDRADLGRRMTEEDKQRNREYDRHRNARSVRIVQCTNGYLLVTQKDNSHHVAGTRDELHDLLDQFLDAIEATPGPGVDPLAKRPITPHTPIRRRPSDHLRVSRGEGPSYEDGR